MLPVPLYGMGSWISSMYSTFVESIPSIMCKTLLGCVIFFPQLAHVVNWGVRRGAEPLLRCIDCIARGVTRGFRGAGTPLYGVRGSAPENFGFGTYVRLGRPTYGFLHDFRTCFWTQWFSVHGFWSMVLDALACINMYYNIERNIMKKIKLVVSVFGFRGKSLCTCVLCVMLSHFLFSVF